MGFSCFYCNTVTNFDVYFEAKTFACPSCERIYFQSEGEFRFKDKFEYNYEHTGLELGKTAIIKGKEYLLSGILYKKAFGTFYWKEYILHNKELEFVYLSEADGHWILLKEIDEGYDVRNHPKILSHQGKLYNIYEYYHSEILSALGYFDFDVSRTKVHVTEYISPPFIISIEKTDNVQTEFFGEHISKSEVKKAFGGVNLPSQNGVGIVQPFIVGLWNVAIIFCGVLILIIMSNWFLNKDQVERKIVNTELHFADYIGKDYITPSFELKGSSAPMTVAISSNVDNSWANVQIALINEKTGEETYANKDIEYYHGYTDGESWTEGSTSEEFNICGVSQGKYHLAITPMQPPEDLANPGVYVRATWNSPSDRNVWMVGIFMAALFGVLFFINRYYETKRWEDSSYSPYAKD